MNAGMNKARPSQVILISIQSDCLNIKTICLYVKLLKVII